MLKQSTGWAVAVAPLTVSDIVSVPDATEPFVFVVSALNEAAPVLNRAAAASTPVSTSGCAVG